MSAAEIITAPKPGGFFVNFSYKKVFIDSDRAAAQRSARAFRIDPLGWS
jgi:hypothetical protein